RGARVSIPVQRFQVGDDVRTLLRILQPECHIVAGHYAVRIGEPFVERGCIPNQASVLHTIRVREARNRSGRATEHTSQPRPRPLRIECVTAGAHLFKQLLTPFSVVCAPEAHAGNEPNRYHRYPRRWPHYSASRLAVSGESTSASRS